MFKNYMLTAVRNLLRHKQYTLINVFGLAVGLAACLLILLYVNHELNYDKWIPENDRVMRMETSHYNRAGEFVYNSDNIPPVSAPLFAEQLDDIELFARFLGETIAISVDGRAYEQDLTISDPDVFELMGVRMIEGDAATALDDPSSIVLSETDAKRIFGDRSALGQTVKVDGQHLLKVTGVMADWQQPSDLEVHAFAPNSSPVIDHQPWLRENWGSFSGPTYIRVREGTNLGELTKAINEFALRVAPSNRFQDRVDRGIKPDFEFYLTPAIDAHLKSPANSGDSRGSMSNLMSAGLIALLILVIAVINVANLGTMLAIKRVREVAIRKALGAMPRHLMVQILVESVALTFLSMLVGLVITETLLPWFGDLMNRSISSDLIYQPTMISGLLAGTAFVGIVCGLYPALVAIKFRPVDYLCGMKPSLGVRFRNILIVLQFAATIGLLATCIVVFLQAKFAQDQDKGFESAQLVEISGIARPVVLGREEALRQALSRLDGIEAVAASHGMPGHDYNNNNGFRVDNGADIVIRRFAVSEELLPMLDVAPIAGRLLSKDYPADAVTDKYKGASGSIVINDIAVQRLGFENAEDAIGHAAYTFGDMESTIVGVVGNLRTRSARSDPSPTYYWVGPHEFRHVILKVKRQNMAETLAAVDRVWREFFPDLPIRRQFVDDAFAKYYDNERRQGWLLLFSASVMIIIAVMGLYGLAALATERRAKEIGIRKVLGAQSRNIVQLLLWQFSAPILVANLIAWPLAWWGLAVWLESFVDRIGLSVLPFIAAGLAVQLVAWVTIIAHTMKVARANPIKALRYE